MSEQEHLSTYLKRFNQAIKAYDGSGVTVPALPLQVARFIRNLNDLKFRLQDPHQIGISPSGIILPDDINARLIKASNCELDHPTPGMGEVFVASAV
jgi:hypothetical protein